MAQPPIDRLRNPGFVRIVRRSIAAILVGIASLVLVAALCMRLVEPETFPTFSQAMWWAVVTVATVGYGDVVPVTGEGRLVAVVVILFGMAWVPLVTGAVVAALLHQVRGEAEQGVTAELAELRRQLDELVAAQRDRA